jgi:quercetin dioxygenase-like cupin family protein
VLTFRGRKAGIELSSHAELVRLIPDYLLGALPGEQRRRLDDLIARSAAFRREVDAAAEALASSVSALGSPRPPAAVRARLLHTLGSVDRFAPFFDDLTALFDLPLATMKRLLGRIDDIGQAWETSLLGVPLAGAELFHFAVGPRLQGSGAAGGVLRVRPDVTFPWHSHHGNEVTYVLEGGYVADGRSHGPGTRIEVPGGTAHDYRSAPGRDLIVVVLHHGITMSHAG